MGPLGALYGSSDRYAAYLKSNSVTPEDIAATIYHVFGLDLERRIYDSLNHPQHLPLGRPNLELFA